MVDNIDGQPDEEQPMEADDRDAESAEPAVDPEPELEATSGNANPASVPEADDEHAGEPATGKAESAGSAVGDQFSGAVASIQNSPVYRKLQEPHVFTQIKLVVGIFGLVGAGIGVTGLLILLQFGSGSAFASSIAGVLAFVMLLIAWFIGPFIAVTTGLRLNATLDEATADVAVANAVACYAGFAVMTIVATVLLTAGGGFFDFGRVIIGVLFGGLPTAAVGGGIVYLKQSISPGATAAAA